MASVAKLVTEAGETIWVREIRNKVHLSIGKHPGKLVAVLTRAEAIQLSDTFWRASPGSMDVKALLAKMDKAQ